MAVFHLARAVAGTSAVLLAAGGVGAATATPASAATPAGSCSTGQLPPSILGNPGLKPGQLAGTYIAHGRGPDAERSGYALAVTHPGNKPVVFTGTVRSSAPITAAKVRDEKHDVIHLSADRKTLTYRFINYGAIDGVAFRADCAKTVTFTASADGFRLPTARIFLGAHRVHPTSNPLTIERS